MLIIFKNWTGLRAFLGLIAMNTTGLILYSPYWYNFKEQNETIRTRVYIVRVMVINVEKYNTIQF